MSSSQQPSSKAVDLTGPLEDFVQAHSAFHYNVLRIVKDGFQWRNKDESQLWVAVLRPNMKAKEGKEEEHFAWMKVKEGCKVGDVHRGAFANHWDEFNADRFVCMLGRKILDMEDSIQGLDWFGDGLIVMRAVKREQAELQSRTTGGSAEEAIALD